MEFAPLRGEVTKSMGKKKILVVDFDQEFLRFLSQFLSNEGFNVSTAVDGSSGLEMCKAESPDLIITEAMLPKLHGFELCSRISHGTTKKIPVIIITGIYKDTIYKTEALRTFGASAYFEKPLDPDDLLVSVRKILGLPAAPGKSEKDIDEAIMASLVSAPTSQEPARLHLQTEGVSASQKTKKGLVQDEIDEMLQNTLAEFGLKPEKKKTAPEAPKPKSSPQAPAPEMKSVPDLPAPKPRAASLPPPPRGKKSDVPALTQEFGEFLEKKKRPFYPKIFGAVAGIMILMSAMVFFLKPGKSGPSQEQVVSETTDSAALETAVQPAGEQGVADPGNATAEVKKSSRTQVNIGAKKRPADQSIEAPPQAVEDIKPLVPDSKSPLELQVPEAAGTDAQRETAEEAAEDISVSQVQEPSQGESNDPLAAPPAKLKAGDLVPLADVDIPPRVIKAAEPVYPPAGFRMRVAGSVTINALVSETGDVIQTSVIRGISGALGFNKAAEAAVRKWKFSPAEKSGVKVRVWKPITVTFKLE